ncbi:MAG: 30S ribosomal protein S3 [Candidatus Methanogasteraceae archaeon]
MAVERKFVQQGLTKARMGEYFAKQLNRAGYAGMTMNRTPMGTQITIFAEKPGMVIGKGGKLVRQLTRDLSQFYALDNPQIDVQNVNVPELNAQLMASRIASALERGWYFRKAAHSTLRRIMESRALGCRIVLSGKLTGPRSRVEKIVDGYIVHAGKPAEQIVQHGFATAVMKLGTIGCSIQIVLPGTVLPDVFALVDVEPPEDVVADVSELVAGSVVAEGTPDVETIVSDEAPGIEGAIEEPSTIEEAPVTGAVEEAPVTEEVVVEETLSTTETVAEEALDTVDVTVEPELSIIEETVADEVTTPSIESPGETKGIPGDTDTDTTQPEQSPGETEGLLADKPETRNVDGTWEHRHGGVDWHVMAVVHKETEEA